MSTQTIYPLRLPGIRVPAPANSNLARRLLVVLGLTTTLVPLLLVLFDLPAYQAVPIAVLLGLAGQRLAELALSRHQDLFEPVNLVAAYFILYFAFRAIYVLGWAGVRAWVSSFMTTIFPRLFGVPAWATSPLPPATIRTSLSGSGQASGKPAHVAANGAGSSHWPVADRRVRGVVYLFVMELSSWALSARRPGAASTRIRYRG